MDHAEIDSRTELAADAFNSNPPDVLQRLALATGEWLERLTGDAPAVNDAMLVLLDRLGRHDDETAQPAAVDEANQGWREAWRHEGWSTSHVTPRGQDLTGLHFFGGFGLNPDIKEEGEARVAAVGRKIAEFREFLDMVPAWTDTEELEQLVLAAEARFNLDNGDPLTAEQLAALSGLGLRSLRNLMTPAGAKESGLAPNFHGLVSAEAAAAWLATRPDFHPSLWKHQATNYGDASAGDADEDEDGRTEWLFIPVAADGTAFTPDLRRGRYYTVGLRDSERQFEDYREALAHVASMTRPSWRRPNPNGNWGIVRARDWVRRNARSLGLEA